ncbi:shufflon system plasmid conjugative transfer pilus tip adhesin PilV, partial [Enterobacter kobei]|uniref:shufflon system plasmid conjugative transfer pilus tip adhesin PilV n=1 Tax=Enterobacter kobei TaxID=208224 RepID=UPI003982E58E
MITLDEIHTANTACPVNGAVSRDASGAILSCQSGRWKSGQVKFNTQVYNIGQNVKDQYIGIHAYCS